MKRERGKENEKSEKEQVYIVFNEKCSVCCLIITSYFSLLFILKHKNLQDAVLVHLSNYL
jgi:hypothetical protein